MKHKSKLIRFLVAVIALALIVLILNIVFAVLSGKNQIELNYSYNYPAGGDIIAKAIVTDEDNHKISKGIKVELYDQDDKKVKGVVFSGKTEKDSDTEIRMSLPNDLAEGDYMLKAKIDSFWDDSTAHGYIHILKNNNRRIVISMDKGIYKPGDTIKYSAMILSNGAMEPVNTDKITIDIYDGNDNRVYSENTKTTDYGIVFGDFTLADEVNSGTYKICVKEGSQEETKNFVVNPYVTPQFEAKISTDKEAYKTGENATVTVDARYFFGQPVANAKVIGRIGTTDVQGYTNNEGNFQVSYNGEKAGKIAVNLEVTDDSNYLVEATKVITFSDDVINIDIRPEYNNIIKGINNTIYIFAKDLSGNPIKTHNKVSFESIRKDVITDENGIGKFVITSEETKVLGDNSYNYYGDLASIIIESKDMNSNEVRTSKSVTVTKSYGKIVTTDNVLFNQGDDIKINIENTSLNVENEVYVMKKGQLLKIVTFSGDDTTINLGDVSGIIDLYEKDLINKRTIFIRPSKALNVEMSGEEKEFKPGDKMTLNFKTTDENGEIIDSNILLSILDEAVINLADYDLSIDNIKLALQDIDLGDEITAADLYASVIDGKSEEKLMEVLIRQESTLPNFSNSSGYDENTETRVLTIIICIVVIIISVLALVGTIFSKSLKDVGNAFKNVANVFGIFIMTTAILYAFIDSLSTYYYDIDIPLLIASLLISIAVYILILYRYRNFLFDVIYKITIAPAVVALIFAFNMLVAEELLYTHMNEFLGIILLCLVELVAYIILMIVAKNKKWEKLFEFLKNFAISAILGIIFNFVVYICVEEIFYSIIDSGVIASIVSVLIFMVLDYVVFYRGKKGIAESRKSAIQDGKLVININGNAIIYAIIMIVFILIGSIAMYIYTSSQATITSSMTSMSTGEIESVDRTQSNSRWSSIGDGDSSLDSIIDGMAGVSSADTASTSKAKSALPFADTFNKNTSDSDGYDYVEEAAMEESDNEQSITSKTNEGISIDGASAEDTAKEEKVRNLFLESLAFIPNIETKDGNASQDIQLSDNITTWNIQAVGNTKNGNVGYTSSNFKVFKEFFVNYTLPTNAVVTDKVKIPVTVYNYTETEMTVNINVVANDWSTLGEYTHDVVVAPKGTTMVYVPLEITKEGINTFRVECKGNGVSDIVEKNLTVKPNGVETEEVVSSGIMRDDYYQDVIFDEKALDNSKKLKVKLYPSDMNIVLENIDSMLQMPTGCFEQTSSSLYPDVLILEYLKENKLDDEKIREKAEEYICSGYQRLLTYEVPGTRGGYSLYGNSPAEPVLTAFGLMEMKEASKVYPVDEKVIENMKEYLLGCQKVDGTFNYTSTYIGSSASTSKEAMNAYIIWALSEAGVEDSRMGKSIEYVESIMDKTTDSYTLALIANTFSNTENKNVDKVLDRLIENVKKENNYRYLESDIYDYYGTRGRYQNVQTSALTAMALFKENKEKSLCEELMEYIVANRDYYGAWGTTQSTILALKAINVSTARDSIKEQTIKVKVNDVQKEINVEDKSLSIYELEFDNVKDENKVEVKMQKGKVSYEIIKKYSETYEDALAKDNDKLTISQVLNTQNAKVNDVITQTITINNSAETIANGLVKINIPQGCSVKEELLARLKAMGEIDKYEYNYNAINLYLRNVDIGESITLEVEYRANYPVDITGCMVKVYDYYNPEISSITMPEHIVVTE